MRSGGESRSKPGILCSVEYCATSPLTFRRVDLNAAASGYINPDLAVAIFQVCAGRFLTRYPASNMLLPKRPTHINPSQARCLSERPEVPEIKPTKDGAIFSRQ